MKQTKVIFVILAWVVFRSLASAQVGIVPSDNPPFFGVKFTHLASHDYVVLVCDSRTGEVAMATKQGIILKTTDYDEIMNVTMSVGRKFCSFVTNTTKELEIKYEISSFNIKVAKLYGRL